MTSESFNVGFGDSNRNSSRVLNPPGGVSSDIFGTNSLAHGPRSRNVSHLQSSFSLGDAGPGGCTVYDVFPEKWTRSPATAARLTRSEVMPDRGAGAEKEIACDSDGALVEPQEEELLPNEDGLDIQNEGENKLSQTSDDRKTYDRGHSTGHIQLPRVGSRNPITGFGIGEDDTREISSVGCDSHNDNSGSGRSAGKRMFNTYNKRSQQW